MTSRRRRHRPAADAGHEEAVPEPSWQLPDWHMPDLRAWQLPALRVIWISLMIGLLCLSISLMDKAQVKRFASFAFSTAKAVQWVGSTVGTTVAAGVNALPLPGAPAPLVRTADGVELPANKTRGKWNVAVGVIYKEVPDKESMEFIYGLYSMHFIRVVFMGPTGGDRGQPIERDWGGLEYLACHQDCKLWTGYICSAQLLRALEMEKKRYAGYLLVHSDVVFHLSVFDRLSLTSMWLLHSRNMVDGAEQERRVNWTLAVHQSRKDLRKNPDLQGWVWWETTPAGCFHAGKPVGAPSLVASWDTLDPVCKRFYQKQNSGVIRTMEGAGDAYYIPARVAPLFQPVANHFHAYSLWTDIATPVMLDCLAHVADVRVENMRAAWLWKDLKKDALEYAKEKMGVVDFFHPLKLLKSKEREDVFRTFFMKTDDETHP